MKKDKEFPLNEPENHDDPSPGNDVEDILNVDDGKRSGMMEYLKTLSPKLKGFLVALVPFIGIIIMLSTCINDQRKEREEKERLRLEEDYINHEFLKLCIGPFKVESGEYNVDYILPPRDIINITVSPVNTGKYAAKQSEMHYYCTRDLQPLMSYRINKDSILQKDAGFIYFDDVNPDGQILFKSFLVDSRTIYTGDKFYATFWLTCENKRTREEIKIYFTVYKFEHPHQYISYLKRGTGNPVEHIKTLDFILWADESDGRFRTYTYRIKDLGDKGVGFTPENNAPLWFLEYNSK